MLPTVITVSGAHRRIGKTLLVERLLAALPRADAVKVQARPSAPRRVFEETDAPENPEKDTQRYLCAGAAHAFLLSGPPEELLEDCRRLIRESERDVVIFETNSLAPLLEPDLAFFVEGEGEEKPGAAACRELADVIVSGLADPT